MKERTKYEVQDEPLFTKDLGKDEFGVYQVEHIHIAYTETVENKVEGRKIPKKVKQKKTLCLRLEHLPAGAYFFIIEKDGKAKTIKVIKIQ